MFNICSLGPSSARAVSQNRRIEKQQVPGMRTHPRQPDSFQPHEVLKVDFTNLSRCLTSAHLALHLQEPSPNTFRDLEGSKNNNCQVCDKTHPRQPEKNPALCTTRAVAYYCNRAYTPLRNSFQPHEVHSKVDFTNLSRYLTSAHLALLKCQVCDKTHPRQPERTLHCARHARLHILL